MNPFRKLGKRRTELYCHNCGRDVHFVLDMSKNGNHVLSCPKCGHEHCRVVRDGRVTGDRWDSRNSTYQVTGVYATCGTSAVICCYSSSLRYVADYYDATNDCSSDYGG